MVPFCPNMRLLHKSKITNKSKGRVLCPATSYGEGNREHHKHANDEATSGYKSESRYLSKFLENWRKR